MIKRQKKEKLFLESVGEDELDFFFKFLKKQFTKVNKKIVEIEELEQKKGKGESLHENQLDKISKKGELQDRRLMFDEAAKLYQQARQENPEQAQKGQQQPQQQVVEVVENTIVESVVQEVDNPETVRDVITAVLNLSHVAEFFKDSQSRAQGAVTFGVSEFDFEVIANFYRKVLQFSESASFDTIEIKRESSLQDLLFYLNQEDRVVVLNTSYNKIYSIVERIANHPSFLALSPKIDSKQQPPIGSEIKTPAQGNNQRKESYSANKVDNQQLAQQHHSGHHQTITQTEQHEVVTIDKVTLITTIQNDDEEEQQEVTTTENRTENVQTNQTQIDIDSQTPDNQQTSTRGNNNNRNNNNDRRGGNRGYYNKNGSGGQQERKRNNDNRRRGGQQNQDYQQQQEEDDNNNEPQQQQEEDEWHVVGKKPTTTSNNQGGNNPRRNNGNRNNQGSRQGGNRPPREDRGGQREGGQREGGQREGGQREGGQREGGQREGGQREGGQREDRGPRDNQNNRGNRGNNGGNRRNDSGKGQSGEYVRKNNENN